MKRIMDEEMITARMKDNPYCEFLQDLKIPVFLIEYMAGPMGRKCFISNCQQWNSGYILRSR